MSLVKVQTYEYYSKALCDDTLVTILEFDSDTVVGAGSIWFFHVIPNYCNPTGKKAYIINMYTNPAYRKNGIASKTLDLLVSEARNKGINVIFLEATNMGGPVYEKYGFVNVERQMELTANSPQR